MADHEPHVAFPAVIDEPVRPARRVGPHDHLGLCRVDRQLRQRVVQHGDVIDRRARTGVPGSQQPGEGLAGGVEIGQQR